MAMIVKTVAISLELDLVPRGLWLRELQKRDLNRKPHVRMHGFPCHRNQGAFRESKKSPKMDAPTHNKCARVCRYTHARMAYVFMNIGSRVHNILLTST
jgi:hypothetical protein